MRICEDCDQAVPTHDIFFKLGFKKRKEAKGVQPLYRTQRKVGLQDIY
jgi:hypothetical protein